MGNSPGMAPVMEWFQKNANKTATAMEIAEALGLEKIQVQVAISRLRSRGVPIEVITRGNVYRYVTDFKALEVAHKAEAVAAPQPLPRRSVVRPIGNGFKGSLAAAMGRTEGVAKGDTLTCIARLREGAIALQSPDGTLWRATPIE